MIPLFKVFMSDTVIGPLSNVLQSGYIGEGKKVKDLENVLRKWFDNENVLLVNSGTSAIHLALDVIREEHNLLNPMFIDVLCTPLSCLATALPIKSLGFNIKWIDIDKTTLNIDLDDLERKLNERTRIVMLVHWGGSPVDLIRLEQIKKKYLETYKQELIVIEDSAHCFDSRYNNENIGKNIYNNYLCYSFQAIKFLTTVDGGVLITPKSTFRQAKLKRWFGLDRDAGSSMRCLQKLEYTGFKFQPNDVLATIGLGNFRHAVENVKKHKVNALHYKYELSNVQGIKLLKIPEHFESSFWIYTLLVDFKEHFKEMMFAKGIEVSEVHQRMDTQPIFDEYKSFLPNMDSIENRYISIPVGWWLTVDEVEYIIKTIKNGW